MIKFLITEITAIVLLVHRMHAFIYSLLYIKNSCFPYQVYGIPSEFQVAIKLLSQ